MAPVLGGSFVLFGPNLYHWIFLPITTPLRIHTATVFLLGGPVSLGLTYVTLELFSPVKTHLIISGYTHDPSWHLFSLGSPVSSQLQLFIEQADTDGLDR